MFCMICFLQGPPGLPGLPGEPGVEGVGIPGPKVRTHSDSSPLCCNLSAFSCCFPLRRGTSVSEGCPVYLDLQVKAYKDPWYSNAFIYPQISQQRRERKGNCSLFGVCLCRKLSFSPSSCALTSSPQWSDIEKLQTVRSGYLS